MTGDSIYFVYEIISKYLTSAKYKHSVSSAELRV